MKRVWRLAMLLLAMGLAVYVSSLGVASAATFETSWGEGGRNPGEFEYPRGVAVDSRGHVYVADTFNDRIQKFTADGGFLRTWGRVDRFDHPQPGSDHGEFARPSGVAVDSHGHLYVADTGNDRIQKFSARGRFLSTWGRAGSGPGNFNAPEGIAVDSHGRVYVADTGNDRIEKFKANGRFLRSWGSRGGGHHAHGRFLGPRGVAVDARGHVYVADTWNHRIQKLSAKGHFLNSWGKKGEGPGEFYRPCGVAVDAQGQVYVADTGFHTSFPPFRNQRIEKFTTGGHFLTAWGHYGDGPGEFYNPHGVAVDAQGQVYVADTGNRQIQKFSQ